MLLRGGRRLAIIGALSMFVPSGCADNDRVTLPDQGKEPPSTGGASGGGRSAGGGEGESGGSSSGGAATGGGGGSQADGGRAAGGKSGTGGIDGGADTGTDGGGEPAVTFSAPTLRTWEGTGRIRIPFTLSVAPAGDVTIPVVTGGAAEDADFDVAPFVTVPAGTTEGAVEVTVVDDDVPEHDETLVIRLVDGNGVTSGSVPYVTITMEDDELRAWQGLNAVAVADDAHVFGTNLSDLAYRREPSGSVLWAVQNGPSKLYRLRERGDRTFAPDTAQGWGAGKTLRWPGAEKGSPDAEGLTFAEATSTALYASTERDNGAPNQNRFSVLRFEPGAPGNELTATHEWNVTADIPAVSGPNLGLEALAWIPDAYLVAQGFHDEGKNKVYAPADYPNHGEGVFVVGVEATGVLYVYALDAAGGTFHRLAEIQSGFVSRLGGSTVVGLSFDREQSVLWAMCDNNCDNRAHVLKIETNPLSSAFGRFQVRRRYAAPQSMPVTLNNEGLAFAPLSECSGGVRGVFWSDDSATDGHVLRRGTLMCDPVF